MLRRAKFRSAALWCEEEEQAAARTSLQQQQPQGLSPFGIKQLYFLACAHRHNRPDGLFLSFQQSGRFWSLFSLFYFHGFVVPVRPLWSFGNLSAVEQTEATTSSGWMFFMWFAATATTTASRASCHSSPSSPSYPVSCCSQPISWHSPMLSAVLLKSQPIYDVHHPNVSSICV